MSCNGRLTLSLLVLPWTRQMMLRSLMSLELPNSRTEARSRSPSTCSWTSLVQVGRSNNTLQCHGENNPTIITHIHTYIHRPCQTMRLYWEMYSSNEGTAMRYCWLSYCIYVSMSVLTELMEDKLERNFLQYSFIY